MCARCLRELVLTIVVTTCCKAHGVLVKNFNTNTFSNFPLYTNTWSECVIPVSVLAALTIEFIREFWLLASSPKRPKKKFHQRFDRNGNQDQLSPSFKRVFSSLITKSPTNTGINSLYVLQFTQERFPSTVNTGDQPEKCLICSILIFAWKWTLHKPSLHQRANQT